MNRFLKNWLSQNKSFFSTNKKRCKHYVFAALLIPFLSFSQNIGNYVNNGSFEDRYDCSLPNPITKAKYWLGIDSMYSSARYFSSCSGLSTVPLNAYTFQWAKSGESYVGDGFFCPPPTCSNSYNRGYFRNRLKQNLQHGKTYCVSFYVNITTNSTYGMDGFGAYFGDNSIDTITKTGRPLTYLTPQIENPINNIITDTLNWTLITGTFVASGHEKFMVIGNFKSDAATNTVLINPTNLPAVFTDVCIDAVSCIELDLPAYAGPDRSVIPGDSAFIGREPDFAIDPGCFWYRLPGMVPLDTISGLWVKPTVTTTYVVKQVLDCSAEKWDTVIVYMNLVGLFDPEAAEKAIRLFPNPARHHLELEISNALFAETFRTIRIYDQLGQIIREEEISIKQGNTRIATGDMAEGVYWLQLRGENTPVLHRRFVIRR
jgi:hypothetical protein